jgi:hypothetical protein
MFNVSNNRLQVNRLVAEVRDIADRAQGDIGLDYAWLDDVTFTDWQRYHDLERSKSVSFNPPACCLSPL